MSLRSLKKTYAYGGVCCSSNLLATIRSYINAFTSLLYINTSVSYASSFGSKIFLVISCVLHHIAKGCWQQHFFTKSIVAFFFLCSLVLSFFSLFSLLPLNPFTSVMFSLLNLKSTNPFYHPLFTLFSTCFVRHVFSFLNILL